MHQESQVRPDPALLERLATMRFVAGGAKPGAGAGERRSEILGNGLEFASYRPYRPGDDMRHIDHRLRARLGRDYLRQYSEDRQLPITIMVDASLSMLHGVPDKFTLALELAQALGFIGLAGGDRVQFATSATTGAVISPAWQGVMRSPAMMAWTDRQSAKSQTPFDAVMMTLAEVLPRSSLVIVLSDLYMDDLSTVVGRYAHFGHDLLMVHIESPDEIDPSALGQGATQLVDRETGQQIDIALDDQSIAAYVTARQQWREEIRQLITGSGGRYLTITTGTNVSTWLEPTLHSAGIIR